MEHPRRTADIRFVRSWHFRGDALRRPGTVVHAGPASSRVPGRHGPAGRPTGSPLHRLPEGFAPLRKRTESCRLFPTKQPRDASPLQGEAGAQRRVRVGCVVD
jgi:hypothetical protein